MLLRAAQAPTVSRSALSEMRGVGAAIIAAHKRLLQVPRKAGDRLGKF
jgi:hypothetical protein